MTNYRLRNLLVICLATGLWAFSFGVGSQLVSHWLKDCEATNELIGRTQSSYYLGLALASFGVPWLSRRLGARSAGLGMIACGPTLALFPWTGGAMGWIALRLVSGAASALSLIPLEATISHDSRSSDRARNFAFYGVGLTLGGALGMWAGLNLYDSSPVLAFYLGAAAPVFGGIMLLRWLRADPTAQREQAEPVRLPWRRHFLSFGTAWSQGFLEGGMLTFLALYLESRGFSTGLAGDLMGVTTVGVLLFQVPVSWLADRYGRVPILLGCYGVVLVGLASAPYCQNPATLACCLFAFGACAGAMYPLGLALLGEDIPQTALARTYAWYLAMECVGSLMGPEAMGKAIDLWGEGSLFAVGIAGVGMVLVMWTLVRPRKPSAPGIAAPHFEPQCRQRLSALTKNTDQHAENLDVA